MNENHHAQLIVNAALKVHRTLGPGLLESSYEACLTYELLELNLKVERQKAMPIIYNDVRLDCGYRLDLIVENKIVVEIKAVTEMHPIFFAQTLTYLKLSGCKLGLLINFNEIKLKDGIRRVVNGL